LEWFGPDGWVPVDVAKSWRPRWGMSLYDAAVTPGQVQAMFGGTVAALVAVTIGLGSRLASVVAAVLWASLLHRGPMLVGPADDCLSVLLWCLAVGPCGNAWSVDAWLADRAGRRLVDRSSWARVSWGLLLVHASVITLAALLAQVRGDVWWDGTAAWWLASRAGAIDLRAWYLTSEYLLNLVTHAIVAFEIAFAVSLWFEPTRQAVAWVALVAWPLVGMLAGEPLWGAAMAIFAVPCAMDDISRR